MRGIINFFLRNSVAANLLMVFIFIMGYLGLTQLKTTFFPENPSRIINIQLFYPGASPQEMEEGVVNKIEENLVGIAGVKQTSSVSSENAATITVEAYRGFDTDLVLQDVKNAVDQISSFPGRMEPPIIFKRINYSASYIFSLSGNVDLRTLKKYARVAEDDLLAIDGISKVEISGFPEEEIEISFRESDMRALNITFDEAVNAVSNNNLLTTGGTIKTEKEELLIRAKNKSYYAQELSNIPVRSNSNGGVIYLHQIANIKDQWQDNPSRTFVNGQPAVIIQVSNTTEEDMFDNANNTYAYLETFRQKYPMLEVKKIRDGKEYLNGRIEFIKENGLIGFLIVLLLLAMFLNWRLAFWVALAIPISFAGMFMLASQLGVTINVISTFGMVVVIGILVDDGIVIAENIYQHYERYSPERQAAQEVATDEKEYRDIGVKYAMKAALEGTMEVLPAVTSAIITTVIAFSTFFFVDGFLGEVFPQLSIVAIFTLVFSLIEGALILPAHVAHSKALQEGNSNRVSAFFDRVMDFLKSNVYAPVLRFAMNFPFPTLALCIMGLLITFGALTGGIIRGTFFPSVQRDNFGVTVEMPAGTREDQVLKVLNKIEKAAVEINEELKESSFGADRDVFEVIEKNIGPTSYQGNMNFYLMKGEERDTIDNRYLVRRIKEKIGRVDGVDKLIFTLGNVFGDPISISLVGTNPVELNEAVEDLKRKMSNVTGVVDIQDSDKEGLKELSLQLTAKAKSLGFTLNQIMRYVRQGFFGAEIQRLQRGQDEVKVWVRYDLKDRSSILNLTNMRIRTSTGQAIPIGQLVDFKSERGIVSINHINGRRETRITADVRSEKVSISDVNADINAELIPLVLEQYPSVSVNFEGQAKENAETVASLQKTMMIILLCMFFVIIITFSSVSQAMVVFFLIPFGLIGVGFGHWFMGKPISLLSILGVIALVGILVNDALVFISTFNANIKNGMSFSEALFDTGTSRFRPILLTTVTTLAGLMPLLLEKSVQAQFLIPMAIAVAFGLLISTIILLVMIPALLKISNRMKIFTYRLWTGEKIASRMVEPANPDREHIWPLTLISALIVLGVIIGIVQAALALTGKII